jgi:hypothetical protein
VGCDLQEWVWVSLELLHDVWRHCSNHVVGTGPLDFDTLRGARESSTCRCGGGIWPESLLTAPWSPLLGGGRTRDQLQARVHCYACDGPRESALASF